jgi:HSP20 family molecular chaperone IbpA
MMIRRSLRPRYRASIPDRSTCPPPGTRSPWRASASPWNSVRTRPSTARSEVSADLPGLEEEDVDRDKIKASFKNGVLKVTLAKTPEAKSSRKVIPVATE